MAKNTPTSGTSSTNAKTAPAGKEKKVKAERVAHPMIGNKTSYPFDTMPTDFSFAKNKGLGKKDFKDGTGFMEYRAAMFKYRGERMLTIAEKLAKKAVVERQFGSEDLRKKARKYAAMQEEMANIRKLLEGSGIDPATLDAPKVADAAPAAGAPAAV